MHLCPLCGEWLDCGKLTFGCFVASGTQHDTISFHSWFFWVRMWPIHYSRVWWGICISFSGFCFLILGLLIPLSRWQIPQSLWGFPGLLFCKHSAPNKLPGHWYSNRADVMMYSNQFSAGQHVKDAIMMNKSEELKFWWLLAHWCTISVSSSMPGT